MRDEIQHGGYRIDQLPFVADAAARLTAAMSPGYNTPPHDDLAEIACDRAEALWAELCKRYPDDVGEDGPESPEGMWVIFDGPPAHESGRFVEVEDINGRGVESGAEWGAILHSEGRYGFWKLGPFYRAPPNK